MAEVGGPTIRDVAARAGVSIATVSNLINGTKNVSPATALRIDSAIGELGFVPNRAVRTLRGERISAIGLVVPGAANPFFVELWHAVQAALAAHQHVVMLCDSGGDLEQEQSQLRDLAEMRVKGVLLTSVDDTRMDLSYLRAAGARAVLLGDPKADTGAASINIDQARSGYLAMEHLLRKGRRNIVFAGGPGGGRLLAERVEGARRAVAESGLGGKVVFDRIDTEGPHPAQRRDHAHRISSDPRRFDGVICANDVIAISLVNNLIRAGVSVPHDVAIVGHDGIEAAADALVPITTITQPIALFADRARALLFDDSIDPPSSDQHIFEVTLTIRESA